MKYRIVYDDTDDLPISVVVYQRGGPHFVAGPEHPNFTLVVDALEQGRPPQDILDLFDTTSALARGFRAARKLIKGRGRKRVTSDPDAVQELAEKALPALDLEPEEPAESSTPKPASPAKPAPEPPTVVRATPEDDNLGSLGQRELQALARQIGLGSMVGRSNDHIRKQIRDARTSIPDDLETRNQRELQALARQLQLGNMVGKSNDYIRQQIREAREDHLDEAVDLIEVTEKGLFYDGEPIHGALADAIIAYHHAGHRDFTPLVRFVAKLHQNPNPHSREHLYEWMGHLSFAIHEDGDLIAYKGVSVKHHDDGPTYVSWHSTGTARVDGTWHKNTPIPNPVGGVVDMPREQVTFDPTTGCSMGLHVGTVSFAKGYGNALIEVKVHPADVVSVPTENNWQKLRVCRYEVVREVDPSEVKTLGSTKAYANA